VCRRRSFGRWRVGRRNISCRFSPVCIRSMGGCNNIVHLIQACPFFTSPQHFHCTTTRSPQRHPLRSKQLPSQRLLLPRRAIRIHIRPRRRIRKALQRTRRLFLARLLRLMLDITRIPERNKQHERANAHGDSRATREYPAEAFDF
jgi:hypothetical protein